MSYGKDDLVYSVGYIGDKDGWLGDVKDGGIQFAHPVAPEYAKTVSAFVVEALENERTEK